MLKNPLGSSTRWKQMILSMAGILDFLEGVLFQLFPEGGAVGGEGGFVGTVGLVELVFVGNPGGDVGEVMLEDGLHGVDGLVDLRFQGLSGGHFGVEGGHFVPVGRGEGRTPVVQEIFLGGFVGSGFVEGGDVAGEALAQVVDDAHSRDLVQVRVREFVPEEEAHEGHHPAVLSYGFVAAAGGVAMAGGVFQPFGGGEDVK